VEALWAWNLMISPNALTSLRASHFIRHALDQIATTSNSDDKPEDPQIDTLKVAQFIGTYLKQSSLKSFFSRNAGRPLSDYTSKGEKITEIYQVTTENSALPSFMELSDFLAEWSKAVFAKPQQAMRQQLRIGQPIVLNHDLFLVSDMRVIDEYDHSVAYTVLYPDDPDASNCMRPQIS
jgi:anaphase-promoting complex subunit 4